MINNFFIKINKYKILFGLIAIIVPEVSLRFKLRKDLEKKRKRKEKRGKIYLRS